MRDSKLSVTPVREALARLNAERLVNFAPHQGYAVTAPSAQRFESLYELAGLLADACLERIKVTWMPKSTPVRTLPVYGNYPDDMTAFHREIALSQRNAELAEQIVALNDRLYVARCYEPQLFPNATHEVRSLSVLFRSRDISGLQHLLRTHHSLRIERSDALARLVAEAVRQG